MSIWLRTVQRGQLMKILFGLPSATGHWPGDVFTNILSQRTEHDTEILRKEGQQIVKARDQICRFAVDNGFTHVYMQDDDNTVAPGTLNKLIEHDKDIIGVPIMQRGQDVNTCVLKKVPDDRHPEIMRYEKIAADKLKGKELIEVDGIGFGAILIKVEVLEKLYKIYPNPFQQMAKSKITDTEFSIYPMGEDISFCIYAKREGFDIWCDCSVSTIHYGRPQEHKYEG